MSITTNAPSAREPIVVVGHRNPDNDSISSAVAYAHLKNILNPANEYVAMRLGPLPLESQYVLDRFGLPYPQVLTHLHSRVRDAMTPNPFQVAGSDTMRQAGEVLKQRKIRTLVVHDEAGAYQGIIDTTTFANLYLAEINDVEATVATRFATLERPIRDFITTNAPTLEAEDVLSDIREKVLASELRQAVVLDEDGHTIGILTRTDLARTPRRRVILVDHNEVSQAAPGILEAEVVEVVDHHRIGDIQTTNPIQFINMPLGSSASIVASEYLRHQVTFEPAYAAVLLSALLTDTVLLKSPTTTPRDHELAAILAQAAHLEVETFGRELFEARFSGQDGSVASIVGTDSKVFDRGDARFMISQYETVNMDGILEQEADIIAHLKSLVASQNYEFALLLVTDIMKEGSQFLVAGKPNLIEHSFGISLSDHSAWVPGILSRKKQVAPRLLD